MLLYIGRRNWINIIIIIIIKIFYKIILFRKTRNILLLLNEIIKDSDINKNNNEKEERKKEEEKKEEETLVKGKGKGDSYSISKLFDILFEKSKRTIRIANANNIYTKSIIP